MNTTVQFIEQREHVKWVSSNPPEYAFKPKGVFSWLQRLLFKTLQRSGCVVQTNKREVSYTTHTFDKLAIVDQLIAQQDSLFKRFGKCPKRILMGTEDFAELMHQSVIRDHVVFSVPINYSDGYSRRVLGMEIELVPWMRGMVVMP